MQINTKHINRNTLYKDNYFNYHLNYYYLLLLLLLPLCRTDIRRFSYKRYKSCAHGYNKNTIQYKYEYYYSGINLVEFRGHIEDTNLISYTDTNIIL